MAGPLTPPGDVQLSAWLDGELEAGEQARVSSWLNTHPAQAAQVRRWAADRDALRLLLEPQLDEPLPERLLSGARPGRSRHRPRRQLGLAAVLWLASALTGALLGRHWPTTAQDQAADPANAGPAVAVDATAAAAVSPASNAAPWLQRAAAAHAVYAPDKRHPVEVGVEAATPTLQRAQEDHLAHWLTDRLGRPVALFDLRSLGFALVGGRLLPDDPAPVALLMYEDGDQQRVTVYLRRAETPAPAPAPATIRYEAVRGLGIFHWAEGDTSYAVTGALPSERLRALAMTIHQQQPRAQPEREASPATEP